ncbi:hypothetical protein BC628DRAFT_1397784 [Trametes gibbosa]|nr:hypothetical protein BC628DRAFT_1397784 [Trametes gibbosa]
MEWRLIGTKASLADLVEEITGIDSAVLTHEKPLDAVSVARRMSWASKRQTTRIEDKAYSLMGIFSVNMPTIYGEGGNAFVRLQEEIIRQVPDQSIFAWGPLLRDDTILYRTLDSNSVSDDGRYWQSRSLFAWSPDAFVNSGGISSIAPEAFGERTGGLPFVLAEYTVTSHGMRTRLPLVPIEHGSGKTTFLALLGCEDVDGRVIALLLYPQLDAAGRFYVGHYIGRPQVPPNSYFRAVCLSRARMAELVGSVAISDVCIVYRAAPTVRHVPRATPSQSSFRCPCEIVIPTWILANVQKAGFTPSVAGEENVFAVTETTPWHHAALVLRSGGEVIRVHVGKCQCRGRFLCVSVTGTKSAGGMSSAATGAPRSESLVDPLSSIVPRGAALAGKSASPLARCPADHVATWENGAKDFVCGSRTVRLVFRSWMTRADMYSLDVTVGIVLEASEEDSGRFVYPRSRALTENSDMSVFSSNTLVA